MCDHWGLTRWFCGIQEYATRCVCCANCGFNQIDENRAYTHKSITNDGYITVYSTVSSDCFCIEPDNAGGTLCDNPLMGTLWLPLGIITHLICLPLYCYFPTKILWDDSGCATRTATIPESCTGIEEDIPKISKLKSTPKISEPKSTPKYGTGLLSSSDQKYFDSIQKNQLDSQTKWQEDQYRYQQQQSHMNQTYANMSNASRYY